MILVREKTYVEELLEELQRLGWRFDDGLSGYRSDFIEWGVSSLSLEILMVYLALILAM